MSLHAIEVLGPVLIRSGNAGWGWRSRAAWQGECTVDQCGNHFLAADSDSARTMAKRHWLMAHPDYEAVGV
jgi:hypothetical protein